MRQMTARGLIIELVKVNILPQGIGGFPRENRTNVKGVTVLNIL
jgi:hypothetical protein